jgi:hypothetical protein
LPAHHTPCVQVLADPKVFIKAWVAEQTTQNAQLV